MHTHFTSSHVFSEKANMYNSLPYEHMYLSFCGTYFYSVPLTSWFQTSIECTISQIHFEIDGIYSLGKSTISFQVSCPSYF